MEKCFEFIFFLYFEVKLMFVVYQEGDVFKVVLFFVCRKQGEFWAWQVLVEILEEDFDVQIVCYVKVL